MKKKFVIAIICTLFLGSFVLPYDARAAVSKDQAFRLGYDEGYRDGAREAQNDHRSGGGAIFGAIGIERPMMAGEIP